MTTKKIIISSTPFQSRAVLLEDGKAAEFYSDKRTKRPILTNIYKGVVTRVLPGMNSAFIDIGHDKAGFLFGGDVIDTSKPTPSKEELADDPDLIKNTAPIETVLNQGQQIICQVVKEPLGSKGPRISMGPKIPGRYLVLMPDFKHIGISRRIEDEAERQRLQAAVESCKDLGDNGVIIRTAATEATDEELNNDLKYLIETWKEVRSKISTVPAPGVLYEDITICEKVIRDLYSSDISEIICDQQSDFDRLSSFLKRSIPSASEKLRLYEEKTPLFDVFEVEKSLENALSKKSPMPSGGFLIIEQTEALTTIDINTGSYTGNQNQRDTILKTNLEAIPQIVNQLRLRNIGGIIIIDFIDMDDMSDREVIFNALNEAFKVDRARTNILRMSDLGLVQMTRKRTNESLQRRMTIPCPHCLGSGRKKTFETEGLELIRHILKLSSQTGRKEFNLAVRSELLAVLESDLRETMDVLIKDQGISLNVADLPLTAEDLKSPSWDVSYPD